MSGLGALGISRWLTRIQAIGFGLLLFFLIEGVCWLAGFGETVLESDPFVGFSAREPLFALNPLNDRFETSIQREPYFVLDTFNRHKTEDTFRVFVFGGSTVQGRPYSIATAFPRWLQLSLELAHPNRTFEVVNCGGISYASYRLVPIVKECLNYQPDLFILCTGQNEFLEARTYGTLKWLTGPLSGPVKVIRGLATYHAMESVYSRMGKQDAKDSASKKPIMKLEVDALLDYRRGLEPYHRDPEWRRGVIAHFEENIRRIHSATNDAGVPLIVLNPPVNLKDSPPFKSEHGTMVADSQKQFYGKWIRMAYDHLENDPGQAAEYLEKAVEVDPQYALGHYLLGRGYFALRDDDKAELCFKTALVEDVCPLRLLPSMKTFVEDFSHRKSIPYLDLESLLKRHAEMPILGDEILVDHVHPSIQGHQVIGQALALYVIDRFFKKPPAKGWESMVSSAYESHLDTLSDSYSVRGNIRLEGLRKWTKGESIGLPIEMRTPAKL